MPSAIAFPSSRDAGRALYCSGIFNIPPRSLRLAAHHDVRCRFELHGGETRRENMSSIIVVGHKNPDNDAISAAVGYAYLKNELARRAGEE